MRFKLGVELKIKAKFQIKIEFTLLVNLLLKFANLECINFGRIKPDAKLLVEFFFKVLFSWFFFKQASYIVRYKAFKIEK